MNNITYLFGPTGSGKTRLLQRYYDCICRQRGIMSCCLSAEQFLYELIEAVSSRGVQELRHKYFSLDVLMVDNAWLLMKRAAAKKELFSLFLLMAKKNKFVLLAGDIAPEELFDGTFLTELAPVVVPVTRRFETLHR